MTVAEIKEFIIQEISFREEELEHHEIKINTKEHIIYLDYILSMLDELEPNNINQAIKIIDTEKDKLKFDVDKHQIDSCIFEIKNILRQGTKESKQ